MLDQVQIKDIYAMLKARKIHPSGYFDNAGRWYAENQDLIDVRTPSRAFPYSQMAACRTLKYVKKVAEKFQCSTIEQLIKNI